MVHAAGLDTGLDEGNGALVVGAGVAQFIQNPLMGGEFALGGLLASGEERDDGIAIVDALLHSGGEGFAAEAFAGEWGDEVAGDEPVDGADERFVGIAECECEEDFHGLSLLTPALPRVLFEEDTSGRGACAMGG